MNEYRIYLVDRNGNKQHYHTSAVSAQDAADRMREDWKGCYILRISLVVEDWQ